MATVLSVGSRAFVREGWSKDPSQARVRVFNFDIDNTTIAAAAQSIVALADRGHETNIAFLNADCINIAHRNQAYVDALGSMHRLYGDGIGIRLAALAANVTLADNVNGTDLFPILAREASQRGVSLYLFGAREGIAEAAGDSIARATPGLKIAGTAHGYVSTPAAETALINEINASGAKILLVGLGAPNQELWIARNRHRLTVPVLIGVGGLFDYYSGRVRRAPLWVRRAHCEWVWRLLLEPQRLARRYLIGNAIFLARLLRQRFRMPEAFGRAQNATATREA